MKHGIGRWALFGLIISTATLTEATLMAAELKVGDEAPDFKMPVSDGKTYSLDDFTGKKSVVIAWYPTAFTGG